MQDINDLIQYFDTPVRFGAAPDTNKNPRRHFRGTLSNINISIKD